MQFHFHANQSHFHKHGFAFRLILKQDTREHGKGLLQESHREGHSKIKLSTKHCRVNFLILILLDMKKKETGKYAMNELRAYSRGKEFNIGNSLINYTHQSRFLLILK